MNRIDEIFRSRQEPVLSVYMTAGYPELEDTTTVIRELAAAGADIIEIGMPFSDPLADGPVLQQCNQVALQNGISLEVLFRQLKDIRKDVSIPLILMGYLNPVLNYGFENFCRKASEIGVDGIILPDLPLDEYENYYRPVCESDGLHMIFLVTPQTRNERIRKIEELSGGFIYLVSASSTTGAKSGFDRAQVDYFKRIAGMNLSKPCLIGFGISTAETFREAGKYTGGAIIGSAFMKALSPGDKLSSSIHGFVGSIKN